jgi:predicted ferric reductase
MTSSTALWYASRATGVVALVLLTVVVLLGIMVSQRRRLPGLPRFATTSLHRSMSLLAVAFIAVHVVTAVADPYVTIGIAAAVIPFTSPYEQLWLGLGAISFDMIVALIATSLVRARIGRRIWHAVHWLAYACWPVAVLHGVGSSTEMRAGWLLTLTICCVAAVLAAVFWRIGNAIAAPGRAVRPARALAAAGLGAGHSAGGQGADPRSADHGSPDRRLTEAGAR